MLREITYKQFLEWRVFADIEPFDETRQDLRIASIVAAIANVHRGKGKKAFTVNEMRLMFGDEQNAPKQSIKEQIAMGQMIASMYNAKEQLLEEKKQLDEQKRQRADDRRKSRNSVRKPTSRR